MKEKQPFLKRSISVRTILAGIAILFLLYIAVSMIMGPIVGNVFYTVNDQLRLAEPGRGSSPLAYNITTERSLVIPPAPAATQPPVEQPLAGQDRLIIRNGNLTLTVKDALAAQKDVTQVVTELAGEGAFVVSSSARSDYEGEAPYVDMVVRIPATRFDEVMDRISKMAVKVNERTESAQDVTADYTDLKTRLETLEAARDRLLQIMKEAATTDALLQAEQQLTQREADIESLKGQMKFLSESAQLSSITIHLAPYVLNQPIDSSWRPAETVRQAFETLVNSLRGFADFLILFVIAILPWLLLIGAIWYGVSHIIKRRRVRKQEEAPKG